MVVGVVRVVAAVMVAVMVAMMATMAMMAVAMAEVAVVLKLKLVEMAAATAAPAVLEPEKRRQTAACALGVRFFSACACLTCVWMYTCVILRLNPGGQVGPSHRNGLWGRGQSRCQTAVPMY